MTSVLQLNTSMFSSGGQSTQLADKFVAGLRERDPSLRLVTRDLGSEPVPHLTLARFSALTSDPETRTEEQQAVVDFSDGLIAELQAADVVVLGLPMYNFGVPSTLRSYFDHVARARVTFRYGENGAEGLLRNKKVYVFATRGGVYPDNVGDSVTPYVRQMLAFLGMSDVEVVYAEGLAMGDVAKQNGLSQAREQIERLHAASVKAA